MSDATATETTDARGERRASPSAGSTAARGGNGFGPDAPRRSAGQVVTIAVMLVSLVAAAVLRSTAVGMQQRSSRGGSAAGQHAGGAGASLAGMDSYAIALLLGGLRGPLVMVLWANSESQKTNRDLEGVDTQIEWIRLLQPEFDTVHLFQMWNKAYNLSVQMVSLSNKYTTILDAIDYGRSVDAERPNNLNIVREIGRIYSDKLGASYPERLYYRDRVRRETMHRDEAAGVQRGQPGFQRVRHDTMLDPAGNILPQYLRPTRQRPENLPAGQEFYDGSELQFVKPFEPFPYGLSPIAIGYGFHKRAQVLSDAEKQVHQQLTSSVVDVQPALTLKNWADEEWDRGRRIELKAFGLAVPIERLDQEAPSASMPLDAKLADESVITELLHAYGMVGRLADESRKEYERHLSDPEFIAKRGMYDAHMEHLVAMRSLAEADAAYVRAMIGAGPERTEQAQQAALRYRDSIREFGLLTLRYYTDSRILAPLLPPGVTRATLGTGAPGSVSAVTEEDVMRLLTLTKEGLERRGTYDDNAEDRAEYNAYIQRALQRLQQLEGAEQPAQ